MGVCVCLFILIVSSSRLNQYTDMYVNLIILSNKSSYIPNKQLACVIVQLSWRFASVVRWRPTVKLRAKEQERERGSKKGKK